MDSILRKLQELTKEAERAHREFEREKQAIQRETAEFQSPSRKRTRRDLRSGGSPKAVTYNLPTDPATLKANFEGDGDGDWVAAFKAEDGPWTGNKLVVLSLFDGIGGIWQALNRLGIPFIGYSSEVSKPAIQVVKVRHPQVKHVGDVRTLEKSAILEKVDLVVGGFPCQDLSAMGKKEGLHGSRSKLFFDLLRVIKIFRPKWFLVENVMSMNWVDRDEISRHLRVPPFELDSQEITASKRRRVYWTNIPHPERLPRLRDHPSTSLQRCLQNAYALEQKAGVILCSNQYKGGTARLGHVLQKDSNTLRYVKHAEIEMLMGYPADYTNVLRCFSDKSEGVGVSQKQESEYGTKCSKAFEATGVDTVLSTWNVVKSVEWVPVSEGLCRIKETGKLETQSPASHSRNLRQNRQTRILYNQGPTHKSQQEALKENERWYLVGNSFSVPAITYLISPLLKSSVQSTGKPVMIPGPVKEEELSAMEPGDLWALFNEHGRPNWYAVIHSRTGDRFSEIPDATGKRNVTKTPLHIELRYLEMTQEYLEDEEDQWNPNRGTGVLKIREAIDIQTSWTAFSHRVASFVKFEHSYFVYPGKNEVWAVYNMDTLTRYFVYVTGSTITVQNLENGKPGAEGFFATCQLLQRTTEHEVFRKLDLMLKFTNLKDFCFQVPYYFRHEASLLKAEVAGVKSRKSLAFDRQTRPGRKRKGKRKSGRGQYISSDDDENEVEDEVEGDDAEEEMDDVVSVEEALGGEEGMQVENLAGVITILGDSDPDEEGNLDDNGSGHGSGTSTLET